MTERRNASDTAQITRRSIPVVINEPLIMIVGPGVLQTASASRVGAFAGQLQPSPLPLDWMQERNAAVPVAWCPPVDDSRSHPSIRFTANRTRTRCNRPRRLLVHPDRGRSRQRIPLFLAPAWRNGRR